MDQWRSLKNHLGRYPPLKISEKGGWVEGRTAGEAQRGTAILAVTVTNHRLEACAPFLRRRPMGNLPHRDTATSKRPKGRFSERHSGHG